MSSAADEAQTARQRIAAEPVDTGSLHLLVYSYLLHSNCGRTAKAFARTCGLTTTGLLTNGSAPAYLSLPLNSEPADDGVMCIDDDASSANNILALKGKKPPLPHILPAADSASLSGSNSTGGSGYSSCVSIPDVGGLATARKDSAMLSSAMALDTAPPPSSSAHETMFPAVASSATANLRQSVDADRANKLIAHHIEHLHIRQSICASIESREPEVALDLLSTYFRTVLIPPPSEQLVLSPLPLRREFDATLLRFRLDTQYYVELIAKNKELEALQFGQRTLWRYPDIFDTWLNHSLNLISGSAGESLKTHYNPLSGSTGVSTQNGTHAAAQKQPFAGHAVAGSSDEDVVSRAELKHKRGEIMRHITNVAALVAYPDPHKSPLAYLLSQDRRTELAAAVNAAILRAMCFPREPALVTLVRQLATTSAYLVGYRMPSRNTANASISSANGAKRDDRATPQHQPWLLDTFINSDNVDGSMYA
ncbi:hypothetical protein GGI02_005213 [Coemansia sp. RSA 2322]|nr:hypothetical protein GGI02_005213 [Coemansia sp. RSA 2322]